MIRPIYTYGERVLRDVAKEIDPTDVQYAEIIEDMFETMHNANGAGLAAPQIGLSIRIVVIEEELPYGELFKGVFINPKIISTSEKANYIQEGCLSFPGISVWVKRPETCFVSWYDQDGKFYEEEFSGIKARIIQHEIDHLDGGLMIDHMMIKEKIYVFHSLEEIKSKNVITKYPIK